MAQHTLVQPMYLKDTHGSQGYNLGSLVSTVGAGEEPYYKEAASQVFDAGDLVHFDANGLVAVCTDSSGRLNSAILGQAIKDATGTTNAPVYVRAIRCSDVYLMQVYHATLASAVTNQNQLQDVFGIIRIGTIGSGGKWHVDIENTTVEDGSVALAKVRVIGFPKGKVNGVESTIGDTYGFVMVQFVPETTQTTGAGKVRNLQIM